MTKILPKDILLHACEKVFYRFHFGKYSSKTGALGLSNRNIALRQVPLDH